MRLVVFILIMGVCLVYFSGCFSSSGVSTARLPAVDHFDPVRYMGDWYEIARLPHNFERDLTDVKAKYELRPDGRIDVTNTGWKNGRMKTSCGIARLADGHAGRGELEVSFFRPFYGKYRILYLEPDYSAALVTSARNNYFWILARTPELPPERLDKYRKQAAYWGFDTAGLEYPSQ